MGEATATFYGATLNAAPELTENNSQITFKFDKDISETKEETLRNAIKINNQNLNELDNVKIEGKEIIITLAEPYKFDSTNV